MVASVLLIHENLSEDKHVESKLVPCLDEGSSPSSSTFKPLEMAVFSFLYMWLR
ncbi:hypothetical protein KL86DYS2_11573 [uncultured Dysgonomonas sp.]|uniref:N-terminal Ras-GEF domain-containing protein n=1 Tax=uncultured Dysgonomonas sp. TaxID=206096 RepID=A0A212JHZ3_9BACT|nr:hypothetical protein KL86DYS2_11573 [uncultured Dysgonomonas sp.]